MTRQSRAKNEFDHIPLPERNSVWKDDARTEMTISMARKFTYEDFERAANESGLLGEFSPSDLKLAQQDPDAGMSILNYKKDYHAATTDEARALANKGAENVRTSFGEYSGGKDGSGFYVTQLS